ncbi:MAG: Flp pilus assembly complex ATPase component TadA [Armatimonadetes bacterium]|nr:Flp pilus assembly complex ATPase component TadA [Armatimonadota bacterium]
MDCKEVRSELVALLKGEFGERHAAAIEEHLAGCQECAAERDWLAGVLRRIRPPTTEGADTIPRGANPQPIIRVVNALIQGAIRDGASSIALEPGPQQVRVRYRIDGVLREVMQLPRAVHNNLITRIKIMADCNVGERHAAQQGRMGVTCEGGSYDVRVGIMPSATGECVTLQIRTAEAPSFDLERIGVSAREAARLRPLLAAVNGLLLVAGPTGSGKSTVLYSLVQALDRDGRYVASVEEPVYYRLPGVLQTHVNRRAGVTPETALRTLEAAGAEVILLTHICGPEEARAALEAAQGESLVLSALHASHAVAALGRLRQFGLPPYLIASGLQGILSVRLARRVCPECRQDAPVTPEEAAALGIPRDATVAKGVGCEACRRTGYKGRVGLYELLAVDAGVRRLVAAEAPANDIQQAALSAGMRPMRMDAAEKVLAGVTTPAEALRVLPQDQEAV